MGRLRDAWTALRGMPQRELTAQDLIALRERSGLDVAGNVTADTALRHSVVWACCRIRAGTLSMLPPAGYRMVDGVPVEVPLPGLFTSPYPSGLTPWSFRQWRWAASWDRDRYGTAIGVIHARNALGYPASIEPVSIREASIRVSGRDISEVRVNGEEIPLANLWIETVYRPAGSPIGLSPVLAAADCIARDLSAIKFGERWFRLDRPLPTSIFKNTERTLPDQAEAAAIKARVKAATADGGPLVVGRDWEWTTEKADAASAAFLETVNAGAADICRYFDVPPELVAAGASGGSSLTYANAVQRNLDFLTHSLQPIIEGDEDRLSMLLPAPRRVELRTDEFLRMDELTRADVAGKRVASRILAPSEARETYGLAPFTPDQLAEFAILFPNRAPSAPSGGTQ